MTNVYKTYDQFEPLQSVDIDLVTLAIPSKRPGYPYAQQFTFSQLFSVRASIIRSLLGLGSAATQADTAFDPAGAAAAAQAASDPAGSASAAVSALVAMLRSAAYQPISAFDAAGAAAAAQAASQPLAANLTAIAALVSAADKLGYYTGLGAAALTDFTSAARGLLDDADYATMRTTLGLGTAATQNTGAFDAAGAAAAAQAASQPLATNLTALAGLAGVADRLAYFTGAGALSLATLTAYARTVLAAADAASARTILAAAPANLAITTDATTARTLILADAYGYIRMTNAAANAVTVPPNSSVAFPIGTQIFIRQAGAGQTTIVAGAGVTIDTTLTLKARVQNSSLALVKVATDEWDLSGDTALS